MVQGNLIGTDASGTGSIGDGIFAVEIDAPNNTIGGVTTGAGNVISGNRNVGLFIDGVNALNNLVQGNFIGTDATGTVALGNSSEGVWIDGSGNTVGGTAAGAGNTIAYNGGLGRSGVVITKDIGSGIGNPVLCNSIFSNAGLAIDLAPVVSNAFVFGVTPNDLGDADTGPDNLQNFPVLTSAVASSGSITLSGTLNSTASSRFRIQIFANSVTDLSGYGEGQRYLGDTLVTTGLDGNASFTITLPVSVPVGYWISSTATDPGNNTSEFSQDRVVTAPASGSAAFVRLDIATQGTWKGTYGSDGYNVIGNAASYPAYASVNPAGQATYTWAASTSDTRRLQKAAATDRIAATWYASSSFTVDINLNDGNIHRFGAYFLDWDSNTRSERIDVVDAATGTVLNTQTVSAFHNGAYLVWNISGHVQLRITKLGGANAVLSGVFFGNGTPNTSASFVTTDTTTQGTWKGTYGSDGYNVIANAVSYPSYAVVTPTGQSTYTWAASTTDTRALQKAAATDRIAATWYASSSFTVDINLNDGNIHRFGAYFLDWDSNTRSERIDVVDAATGTVLNTQTVSAFHNGAYLVWNISGHVQLRITKLGGANAVLSGVFFGNGTPNTSASFVTTDTTTQGTWKGTYGSDGYNVIANAVSYPSYAVVTPTGQATYTWAASTTDTRALQKAAATDRIAATWYSSSSFTVDINFNDGNIHRLSAYFLDWDSTSRSERIDVVDAATGTVLDTRSISSFHNGAYLVWNISGHVQLRITKLGGANAVLSGLFFGNTA